MQRTRSRVSKRIKVSSDEGNKLTGEKNKVTDNENKVTNEKNKVTNEKNKVTNEKNKITNKSKKVTVKKNKDTDGKNEVTDESNKVSYETTINQLNDDCLVNIFTFLPAVDRVRIQRVCKKWQIISEIPWFDKKFLVLFDNTWSSNFPGSYSRYLNIRDQIDIGLPGIKSVLKLCGQYVTHIRFNFLEGTTEIFKEIKKKCINLQSLDHSESVITHVSRMKYLANNFHFLRHFKLGYCMTSIDVSLGNFFKKNNDLISLSLHNPHMSGYCLQFLPESLESLTLQQNRYQTSRINPDIFYYSLCRLPKLNTLSLTFGHEETTLNLNRILKTLPSNSSIKKLIFLNDWEDQIISLKSNYWERLKNLEYLALHREWILNTEETEVIIDCCQKLSQIIIDGGYMSPKALESILAMPNLRTLILMNNNDLKDRHFFEVTYVEELGIHYCDSISIQGFIRLSENARNLKIIKISIDESSDESIKIDDLKNIFKKINIKIYINQKLID